MWNWSFGDNSWFNTTDATQRNASHTYVSGGTFTVSLSLTNSSGTNTTSIPGYISVTALPSSVSFTASPTSGSIPLFVRFTDTSTSLGITVWNWSLGDNTWFNTTDATQRNAIHTYVSAGSYTVNLTITNTSGTDTASSFNLITATIPTVTTASGRSGRGATTATFLYAIQQAPTSSITPATTPVTPASTTPVEISSNPGLTSTINIVPDGIRFPPATDGVQQFLLNRMTAEHAGYTVESTKDSVTATGSDDIFVINGVNIMENPPGFITGSVQNVNFVLQPAPAALSIGKVSVIAGASLPTLPENGADISITVSDLVPDETMSAFRGVAAQQGQTITSVGYTAAFRKEGITATGPGDIRMTSPAGWVNQHGGIPSVSIVHIGDDNSAEILNTNYAGTDSSGNLIFEADSPSGLSTFGLVTLKNQSLSVPAETQNLGQIGNRVGTYSSALSVVTENILVIAAVLLCLVVIVAALWLRRRKYDWLFMK